MPAKSNTTAATPTPVVMAKARGIGAPLTLLDLADAVINHYCGVDKIVAASKSSSSSSSSFVAPIDKEHLLWAIRTYCFSAAIVPKLCSTVVTPASTSAFASPLTMDVGPAIKMINEVLAKCSATAYGGTTSAATAAATNSTTTTTAAGKAGSKSNTTSPALAPKRPREEDTVGVVADSSSENGGADSQQVEPARACHLDTSTFFDFTGFMAWRARNTLHSQSLMQAALGASNSSTTAMMGASNDNFAVPDPQAASCSSAEVGSPGASASANPRNLLSPTSNLVSHHTNPTTATYFEKCRDTFASPAALSAATGSPSSLTFAHDGDFVSFIEVLVYSHHWAVSVNNLSVPAVLHADVVKIVEKVGITARTVALCSNACALLVQMVGAARLAASTEKPPRLVRMCASFNMNLHECAAMSHVLAVHSGSIINHSISHPLGLAFVGRTSGLDPKGMQHFLLTDRAHIRQGVLHPSDQMMAKLTPDMRILMPLEVVSSLCGANIPDEELVKLENTCLWNVMQAEKNHNYGVIAPKGSKAASAAAAYLASNNPTAGKKARKVTFGNNKLIAALGDLLTSPGDNDDANSSSSSDNESGADTPRTPGSALLNGEMEDCETIDNDDVASSRAGGGLDGMPSTATNDTPYPNDIEYLDDSFRVLAMMIKARNSEGDMKDDDDLYFSTPKSKVEAQLREFAGKQRVMQKRVETRMAATRSSGAWVPRVERVSERLRLSPFEKQLLMLMVGNVVSHDVLVAINGRSVMRDGARELTVGYILFVLCASLPERVACRKCFFESSPLIANGLISLSVGQSTRNRFNTDLMEYLVDIDRSIVDYLMGTDIDPDEMVQGSRLYTPDVPLSHVALPTSVKDKVLSTIEHYSLFAKCKEKCGFGKGLGTGGSGLVFLFHGPSGTGKTMLANAVAHDLKKKILLVNLLQYRGDSKAADVLRYVFREAKLNDAIIFFDECESFFEQRENNSVVTAVLAEFEKYSGMIILATNRAQIIDEAMNRRISLMIEFKLPDHQMREQIWRTHLPANLTLASDINVQELAMDFELSGGLIRNAVLAAMSSAVGREQSESPTLTLADLQLGAKQQLRGFFQATETASQEYVTPLRSLDELVVDRTTKESIGNIAKGVKARNTLFAQWGFVEKECDDQGDICLFYGPSGTGKSLAAEGIAYECSATIRLCNIAEMIVTNTFNIQAVFDEARKLGAIVVFDQAQGLFDYSEMAGKISQLIHYHAVRYPRPVIVIATTSPTGVSSIDTRASRLQFNSEITFQLPTRQLRRELWRRSIPAQVPIAEEGLNWEQLSAEQLSAKAIRSICFSVCCRAALLPVGKQLVSNALIAETQEEYLSRERRRNTHSSMFT